MIIVRNETCKYTDSDSRIFRFVYRRAVSIYSVYFFNVAYLRKYSHHKNDKTQSGKVGLYSVLLYLFRTYFTKLKVAQTLQC